MKHIIEVDCETVEELQQHLTELQEQIKERVKIEKIDPSNQPFDKSVWIIDDNCYGHHSLHVYED
jgi:hypothetical protein